MTVSTTPAPVGSTLAAAAVHPVGLARRARRRPSQAGRLAVRVGTDAVAASVAAGLGLLAHPGASALLVPVAATAWTASLTASRGYRSDLGATARSPRPVLRAGATLLLLGWLAGATAPGLLLGDDPGSVLRAGLLVLATSALLSLLLDPLTQRALGRTPTPLVIIGTQDEVAAYAGELVRADPAGSRWQTVGTRSPGPGEAVEETLDAVRALEAQVVVVVPGPGIGPAELRRLGVALAEEGAALLVGTGLLDVAAGRVDSVLLGGRRVLHVRPASLRGSGRLAKAVTDRVLAGILLVALSPLLALLVLAVRWDSPGGAIYRQVRIGRHGRPFTVYKLRTMCADADRIRTTLIAANDHGESGVLFKIRHDPRITRLGATLRACSLDELPQLVNVVRGEMSLIGPRPPLPGEVARYSAELRRRLTLRPGLTGLWQVSGRSDLSWEETVRLDLAYVDNWSWSLDLAIAARTFGAVAGRRGAY